MEVLELVYEVNNGYHINQKNVHQTNNNSYRPVVNRYKKEWRYIKTNKSMCLR